MKNKIKVSVLVPVYNSEKTLRKCVESIFAQTFSDYEAVFVDDGSTDGSLAVVQQITAEFSMQDKVKIIQHPTNRGVAAARNTAIDSAAGEYIAFVDADDWIENDMLAETFCKAEAENADIVICDYFKYDSIIHLPSIDRDDIIKNLIISRINVCPALWGYLIAKNLFLNDECRFAEGVHAGEDRLMLTRLFYYAQKTVKINRAFYHYQYCENSLTHKVENKNFESLQTVCNQMESFFSRKTPFANYHYIMNFSRAQGKALLMLTTRSYGIRKRYASLFRKFEMHYISHYDYTSLKIIVFLIHFRMFIPAHLFCLFNRTKNQILKR
jgi:glycosyltransferase involved in cell wall biosynthesis